MIIPFAEYAPDKADLDPSSTDMVRNVIPTASGYGPLRAIAQFSTALPGVCRGARVARKADGSFTLFAGTVNSLYQLSGTAWTDVSNGVAPYTIGDGYSWSFAQFGPYVLATNINNVLQIFNLASSVDFANAAGSPPQAHYVYTESGYVGLAQLANFERRIMRSGLEDAEFWTVGQKGCTFQDLPDGGLVQGAVGSETGAFILSQAKSRLLTNQPGLEIGFTLADYEVNRGTIAPYSLARAGAVIAFLSEDGFYILGQPSTPIGSERVDRTFLDDIDLDYLDQVQGVADPVRKMFWWRYRSLGGSDNYSDKLIGYNYQLDRWTAAEVNLEWLISMATLGYTLEELDSVLGYTDLDALPFSLDSRVWKGGRPAFAAIDADHKLGFFEGEPLEALLETSTMRLGGDGRRGFVSGFRPMGDISSGAYGRVGTAENIGGTLTWGTESVQGTTGLVPVRSSGRVQRYRLRVPAGTEWNDIIGIEVPPESVRQAGRR